MLLLLLLPLPLPPGESVLASLLESCERASSRQVQLEANLQRTSSSLAEALAEADRVRVSLGLISGGCRWPAGTGPDEVLDGTAAASP